MRDKAAAGTNGGVFYDGLTLRERLGIDPKPEHDCVTARCPLCGQYTHCRICFPLALCFYCYPSENMPEC